MSANGATGRGPVKKAKHSSQLQVNAATAMNGRHTVSEASSTKSSPTGDISRDKHPQCRMNGHLHMVYRAIETEHIIKTLFYNLLSLAEVEKEVIKDFNITENGLKRRSNPKLICNIIDLSTEYIKTSERSFESFIEEIRTIGLEVTFNTMYTEFRSVTENLFVDGINFGRILSFLRFSAAYAVFVYRQGMKKAVPSVEAWTVEVIEKDLGQFFIENRGWVSV